MSVHYSDVRCSGYGRLMGLLEAGAWGFSGGLAAGLVSLMATVTAAGFRFPWKDQPEEIWPRAFVLGCGVVLGALVAAAAHTSMSGAWPAFIMGLGAPSMVRGALGRVEITERKPEEGSGGEGVGEGLG